MSNDEPQAMPATIRLSAELGPLPPHWHSLNSGTFAPLYTADQMRTYALEARERCAQWVRDNYQDYPNIDSLCTAMICAPSAEVGQISAYAQRAVAAEHARIVKRLRDEATYACPCADDANLTNELADILVAEGVGGPNAELSGPKRPARKDEDGTE